MSDGTYQLNDYNGCIFPSWDPVRNEYCKSEYVHEQERTDIFRLGQLFNYLLRGKRPYDDPTSVTSPINSTHLLDVYAKRAMYMCMRDDPATSRTVAKFLNVGYTRMIEKKSTNGTEMP